MVHQPAAFGHQTDAPANRAQHVLCRGLNIATEQEDLAPARLLPPMTNPQEGRFSRSACTCHESQRARRQCETDVAQYVCTICIAQAGIAETDDALLECHV